MVIEDSAGLRLTPDLYTLDRAAGTITMADPLFGATSTIYNPRVWNSALLYKTSASYSALAICGVASGASYWFAYQPPTNGTATLDTIEAGGQLSYDPATGTQTGEATWWPNVSKGIVQVRAEVLRQVEQTGVLERVGVFVGTSSEINPPIPLANFRAMVAAAGELRNPSFRHGS